MRMMMARVQLRRLRGLAALVGVLLLASAAPAVDAQAGRSELVLLTTTTTQDSGILTILVDAFEKRGYRVKTIVAGSGDILKQGARGEGDVLLTHSPQAEKAWMQEGNGTSRRLVMYNDFIIVGPPDDPAHIKGVSATEALQNIAAKPALFISRGDQSGTHVRELSLWQRLGLNPKGQPWYRETGQGQALTMDVASHQRAYALTDRGTFLVHAQRLDLVVLVEHDPLLRNIYHVMPVNPQKFPKVNAPAAQAFADFLVSEAGQRLIGDFGIAQYGQSLFTPAAHRSEAELVRE